MTLNLQESIRHLTYPDMSKLQQSRLIVAISYNCLKLHKNMYCFQYISVLTLSYIYISARNHGNLGTK